MKKTTITLSLKARIELYLLAIKIGSPFESRFKIAFKRFPDIFKNKKLGVLFG